MDSGFVKVLRTYVHYVCTFVCISTYVSVILTFISLKAGFGRVGVWGVCIVGCTACGF